MRRYAVKHRIVHDVSQQNDTDVAHKPILVIFGRDTTIVKPPETDRPPLIAM